MGFPDGHFYSPVPTREDIERTLGWVPPAAGGVVPGVEFDLDGQWAQLARVGDMAARAGFSATAARGPRYQFNTTMFNQADSATLAGMIGAYAPRRIIEIGSGWSTAVMLDSVEAFDLATRVTAIEPYPDRLEAFLGSSAALTHIQAPVQDVGLELFTELGPDDILFIDSSHVGKAGSDVLYELFQILPRLAPGVLVHLHDIFPGFDYPRAWLEEGRYWNEAYLLRAFLMFNRAFRVHCWPIQLGMLDRERYNATLPVGGQFGGSIWLRRASD